jgi:NAD(P) transhydrogenase subunit alpha
MVTLSVLAQLDILSTAGGGAIHANNDAVDPFVFRLSIFALAVFVGYYVVWSVTPALHTPLMSVTNAISSVIVVGALLAVGVTLVTDDNGPLWARVFGFVALVFASVNIFGGFLVTQRMLAMFQKKQK